PKACDASISSQTSLLTDSISSTSLTAQLYLSFAVRVRTSGKLLVTYPHETLRNCVIADDLCHFRDSPVVERGFGKRANRTRSPAIGLHEKRFPYPRRI